MIPDLTFRPVDASRTNPLPNPKHRSRKAGIVIWILPALAALAGVAVWWLAPARSAASPTETLKELPTSGERVVGKNQLKSQKLDAGIGDRAPKITLKTVAPSASLTSVSTQPAIKAVASESTVDSKSLEEIQQALEGDWSGYYQGQRQLSVRADGTATMIAEPDGLAATLLAPKLTFDVRWTVRKDQLEFETVGGVPEDKVKIVTKMYGRKRSHKILDLQARKLVLRDEDGVTEYIWKRDTSKASVRRKPDGL